MQTKQMQSKQVLTKPLFLITLSCFLLIATTVKAQLQPDFQEIIHNWQANSGVITTLGCDVSTERNNDMTIFNVNEKCNFANFVIYTLLDSCHSAETLNLKIKSINTESSYEINSENCSKIHSALNIPVLNNNNNNNDSNDKKENKDNVEPIKPTQEYKAPSTVKIKDESAPPKHMPSKYEQMYVIQFYSGFGKPDPANIKCQSDITNTNRFGERYYLFSEKLTYQQASTELNHLQEKCFSNAWIRPLPIRD